MIESDIAEGILEQASSFPATPPGATCPCKKPPLLRAGVFFDGTGNNKFVDKPKPGTSAADMQKGDKRSNVVRMYDVWKEGSDDEGLRRKCYLRGVGSVKYGERTSRLGSDVGGRTREILSNNPTPVGLVHALGSALGSAGGYVAELGYDVAGVAGGAGGKTRLNMAYFWLKDRCAEVAEVAERTVDIFGFSRGAAMSRTFTNLVNQGLAQEYPLLKVRFLGIFDTVGSFGLPGDDSDPGENLGIDNHDARQIFHPVALHEYRQNFPLTVTNIDDTGYVGAHSDVGGGYPPLDDDGKKNHLAFIPFVAMHAAARDGGCRVDLDDPDPSAMDGMSVAQVEAFARRAREEAPEKAMLLGEEKEWTEVQRKFYEEFIHQSHVTPRDWWILNQVQRAHPNHIDNEHKRRKLEIRRQTLVALPPDFEWK